MSAIQDLAPFIGAYQGKIRWACIALIVGSVLASAITFYAIRKERGGKHGVHQV